MGVKAAQKPVKVWLDGSTKEIYAKFESNEIRRIDASVIDDWEEGCSVCSAYADEIESIGEEGGLFEQIRLHLSG